MATSQIVIVSCISALIAISAYLFGRSGVVNLGVNVDVDVDVGSATARKRAAELRLRDTLDGLLHVEAHATVQPDTKVAVGFGACLDVIVQAFDVLSSTTTPSEPRHYDVINTAEQLHQVFAYFYSHGAAAERYVANVTLFEELLTIAGVSTTAKLSLGGNAATMGKRFAKEGCYVLLGGSMTSKLKMELHTDTLAITVAGERIKHDDVHLILEYPANATWGDYVSPRANRFIIHSDRRNPKLGSLEMFEEKLHGFGADLMVISGLQMMNNFPFQEGQRLPRLKKVKSLMSSMSDDTRIHFEMASFSDELLLHELAKNVVVYADSLGMNEQELPNINSIVHSGNVSLVSDAEPRIAIVLDQMRSLFRALQSTNEVGGKRKLTRLHVHTLAYQAIITRKNSAWKNSRAAAAKASLMAHRHTCATHKVNLEHARLLVDDSFTVSHAKGSQRVPFNPKNPVSCWKEIDPVGNYVIEICIAPVLVCTNVVKTAGGGDNISSAGLVLQI